MVVLSQSELHLPGVKRTQRVGFSLGKKGFFLLKIYTFFFFKEAWTASEFSRMARELSKISGNKRVELVITDCSERSRRLSQTQLEL